MSKVIDLLKTNQELWDLFVKSEEYDAPLLDKYRRYPHYLSLHRDIMKPVVSSFLNRLGYSVPLPGEYSFAVCLTHDIDYVRFSLVSMGKEVLSNIVSGRFLTAINKACTGFGTFALSAFDKNANPSRNIESIIRTEKKYGAKSSFYFLQSDKKEGRFNGYRFDSMKDEFQAIIDEGCEIGLHGGLDAYLDAERMKRDKAALENAAGKEVIGYRNHYLRFKIPVTWEFLENAGFMYDTTFGYADCAGFRNGMCYPFRPYNLNTGEEMKIWEIPLTVMDNTLFNYMSLDTETAWLVTTKLIDAVEELKGVITILWHNTSMADEMGEFYERILEYCYRKNAWMTSGENILAVMNGSKIDE
ncbi:MAG: polysaccharide deacetylase family protein [Dehalococcoidales bacterium]|nr:polysaccharide deacetylase family protein [Dehalococcoidales bacterium]